MGGIGKVAYLPPIDDQRTPPSAFDTGPANVLIDVVMTLLTDGRETFEGRARGLADEDVVASITALLTTGPGI